MVSMKRAAAAPAQSQGGRGRGRPRVAKNEPAPESVSDVVSEPRGPRAGPVLLEALMSLQGLSQGSRQLLSTMATYCLKLDSEDRHATQRACVGWIEEALKAEESAKAVAVAEAERNAANLDAEKTSRKISLEEAEALVRASEATLADKVTTRNAANQAFQAAMEARGHAQLKQREGDAELAAAAGRLKRLQAVRDGSGEQPLLERAATAAEALEVARFGRDFGIDSSLVDMIEPILRKDKAARGTFDDVALQQLQDAFGSVQARLQATLAQGQSGVAERAAAVDEAAAACAAAVDKRGSTMEAVRAATEAVTAAQHEAAFRRSGVSNFEPHVAKVLKAVDATKADLERFQKGPLSSFVELRDKTKPPEAPEEPQEAPAPEPVLVDDDAPPEDSAMAAVEEL